MKKNDMLKVAKDVKRLNKFIKISSVFSLVGKFLTAAFLVFAVADTVMAMKRSCKKTA